MIETKARQTAYAGVRFLRLFLVFQVYQSRSVACLIYAIFCYIVYIRPLYWVQCLFTESVGGLENNL